MRVVVTLKTEVHIISERKGSKVEKSELERLREFADYVLESEAWGNIDGGDIQDKAIELELVELRPVDENENEYGAKELYFTKWTKKGE